MDELLDMYHLGIAIPTCDDTFGIFPGKLTAILVQDYSLVHFNDLLVEHFRNRHLLHACTQFTCLKHMLHLRFSFGRHIVVMCIVIYCC